jgi:hypothetical protein
MPNMRIFVYMASWLPAQPRNPSPQLTRCPLLHPPVPVHAVSTSPPQGVQVPQGRTRSRSGTGSGTGSELKISRSVQHCNNDHDKGHFAAQAAR